MERNSHLVKKGDRRPDWEIEQRERKLSEYTQKGIHHAQI